MRRLLLVAAVLVLLAGLQLFVFTGHTGTFFAWTIANPLSAAFLGASYWAAVSIEALAGRQKLWANARIAVPAVFVFTVLTLATTLMHLGQFHLGGRFAAGTRIVTIAWIAIYVAVPLLMLVVLFVQLRTPGADPPPVDRPARLDVRPPGRAGGRPARSRRGVVRGARASSAAVALEADPAGRPGDRRLADQPGGGRRSCAP